MVRKQNNSRSLIKKNKQDGGVGGLRRLLKFLSGSSTSNQVAPTSNNPAPNLKQLLQRENVKIKEVRKTLSEKIKEYFSKKPTHIISNENLYPQSQSGEKEAQHVNFKISYNTISKINKLKSSLIYAYSNFHFNEYSIKVSKENLGDKMHKPLISSNLLSDDNFISKYSEILIELTKDEIISDEIKFRSMFEY